jgi:3-hydroxymyristoyl/3-hydroxydecanoyl-(acyl carrier protein) dehydratase
MWRSTELCFAGDHPTAAGHFPSDPIIPGALLLDEIVAAILQSPLLDRNVVIRAAKFLRPVRPGDALDLRWQAAPDGAVRFECRLAGGDDVAVSGTLAPDTIVPGAAPGTAVP